MCPHLRDEVSILLRGEMNWKCVEPRIHAKILLTNRSIQKGANIYTSISVKPRTIYKMKKWKEWQSKGKFMYSWSRLFWISHPLSAMGLVVSRAHACCLVCTKLWMAHLVRVKQKLFLHFSVVLQTRLLSAQRGAYHASAPHSTAPPRRTDKVSKRSYRWTRVGNWRSDMLWQRR